MVSHVSLRVRTAVLADIYVGYALLVRALAIAFARRVNGSANAPRMTVVIAEYNEERNIQAMLENILDCDYPADFLEVNVTPDASTDSADAIVRGFQSKRVQLLRIEGRCGKTACQIAALERASGDIIVFTNATTCLSSRALIVLANDFADASVGCVARVLVFVGKGTNLAASRGTLYWDYEVRLRVSESLGSLIGVSRCLYAARKREYQPIRPDLVSDFVIALQMRENELRAVLEAGAVCFDETLDRVSSELGMRIRVAIRTINALIAQRPLRNPFWFGMFAWQLWSYRVLRYASPLLWMGSLRGSTLLSHEPMYAAILTGHMLILTLGIVGVVIHSQSGARGSFARSYYLVLTNAASLLATIRYLGGERAITRNTARR